MNEGKKIADVEDNAVENDIMKNYTAVVRNELLDLYDVVMRDLIADSETRSEIQCSILYFCDFYVVVHIYAEVVHICCTLTYCVMVG